MENYKEKYEQALDNFKKIKAANKDNKELVDFIEYEYPELKEFEDERIRNEIILYIGSKDIDLSTHNRWLAWLEKQGEQKPAWSGEDSCCCDDICEILINLINSPTSNVNKDAVQKDLDWLMSIEESQLKSSWSEEDENMLNYTISTVKLHLNDVGSDKKEILLVKEEIAWLKSLKDRMKGE